MTARAPHRLQVVGSDGVVAERRAISVLYVEDDEEDVFLLKRQIHSLPSFDVDFAHAATVEAARAMTERHRFDVVLCDFWLGSETTIPLIDELKLALAPCPVVLVSSLDNDDIELIGRRAGAAGFVAKADLSAAALDRIFVTLLPPEDAVPMLAARGEGVAGWLRALMRSLDAVQAAGGGGSRAAGDLGFSEALLGEIAGSQVMRREVIDTLAGLERATRLGAWSVTRFDAVPYLSDAVERLRARYGVDAVAFLPPAMPIMVSASPTLFGDLVQGVFAEAADVAAESVNVSPAVRDGHLSIGIDIALAADRDRSVDAEGCARAAAAAKARRFLVDTLAEAVGGRFRLVEDVDAGRITAVLDVPLRSGD
ncbi:MAG TPA: response regulator [Methylomirabilota bacterium]|nr:response regulator [Methylomirabilota bacterium]